LPLTACPLGCSTSRARSHVLPGLSRRPDKSNGRW
jgi:hypothetical protein